MATARGRCAAHKLLDERPRPSAASRGYDSHWRIVRAAFLRAHPHCECDYCVISQTRLPATDVDHRDGDSHHNLWSNLRAMAHAHHSRRTARDQNDWGWGGHSKDGRDA
jgi:hypothetical protein